MDNFTRIIGITVFDGVWEIKREQVFDRVCIPPSTHTQRRGWTKRSRRELIARIAKSGVEMSSMLVATFPDRCMIKDGKMAGKILNRFLVSLRRRYPYVEYWWVREFQKNGQPHYHIMTNVVKTDIDRLWFGRYWAQAILTRPPDTWARHKTLTEDIIKVHRHPRQWQTLRSRDGATRYLLSYLTKEYQKMAPDDYKNLGRWWGCSRGLKESQQTGEEWPIDDQTLRVVLKSWGLDWVASWEYLPKHVHIPLGNPTILS